MEFVKHYAVVLGLFVAIDAVWLKFVANSFYKQQLGKLLAPKPNFVAAAIFYLIYLAAIVVFVLDPGLQRDSYGYVLGRGALLGLAMYATYDLTNHATLQGWPAKVTYVDMAWGTCITTVVSVVAFAIFH